MRGMEQGPNEMQGPMFTIDFPYVQNQLELMGILRAAGTFTETELRSYMLKQMLGEWYSGLCNGMDVITGHLLYRLTDHVDQQERAVIEVWPGEEREPWLTVEDWRREWERLNPDGIPVFDNPAFESVRLALTCSSQPEAR